MLVIEIACLCNLSVLSVSIPVTGQVLWALYDNSWLSLDPPSWVANLAGHANDWLTD